MRQALDIGKTPPALAPIKSLHALLDWKAGKHPFDSLFRGNVRLLQAKQRAEDRSQLLVCHDLDGNYHSDALPQGDMNADHYRLTDWSPVDLFVYFSHALVTIPPVGWINAAHRNNVPVLGTFITEWAEGSLLCELLLNTEQSCEEAAMQLTRIASYYGFDGWLLNIENPVLLWLLPNLLHFIRVLRKLMHELVPGSQVIWYDAVTTSGVLEWQDTLNDHNLPFFEAADAIFINYTWKEETPQLAAAVAGARKRDVYMGVDVFGRNTYGGGGMSCDVALKAARSAGLSAALFAPAWVWQIGNRAGWQQRQHEFWGKVEGCWEQPLSSILQLPFSTCFDQGAGQALYQEGLAYSDDPWYNLSSQSPLPHPRQPPQPYTDPNSQPTSVNFTASASHNSAPSDPSLTGIVAETRTHQKDPQAIALPHATASGGSLRSDSISAVSHAPPSSSHSTAAALDVASKGTRHFEDSAAAADDEPSTGIGHLQDSAPDEQPSTGTRHLQDSAAAVEASRGTGHLSDAAAAAAAAAAAGDVRSAGRLEARLCMDTAFRLGSCLAIEGSTPSGSSPSVEIFTANLLIPEPGLGVSFTYKPAALPHLDLWCWLEPSNKGEDTALQDLPSDDSDRPASSNGVHSQAGVDAPTEYAVVKQKKQRLLAMLQPQGLVVISPLQGLQGILLSRAAEGVARNDAGWITQAYHLPSSLRDYHHLTLRSIEVAAVEPQTRIRPAIAGACLGYVGHIGLTEAGKPVRIPIIDKVLIRDLKWAASRNDSSSEPEAGSMLDSSAQSESASEADSASKASNGQRAPADSGQTGVGERIPEAQASSDSPESPFSLYLYVTLQFVSADLMAASRFEVYHRCITSSSSAELRLMANSNTRTKSPLLWLGTAFAPEFRVCALPVPPASDALEFVVQPVDLMSKFVPNVASIVINRR